MECSYKRREPARPPALPTLKPKIKVAFASGTDDLNARLIEHMRQMFPELPLYVVAEFQPTGADLKWIRYNANRGFENLARCRAAFRGKSIRLAGVMLVPNVPFRAMRLMALLLAPRNFLAFNENLNHFMLRPRSIPAIARHIAGCRGDGRRHVRRAKRFAESESSDCQSVSAVSALSRRSRAHV